MEQLLFSNEIKNAQNNRLPIVALESTVITHGLPIPKNLEVAKAMEESVRSTGSTPATICILNGRIHVGVENNQLEDLARDQKALKVSRRDLAAVIFNRKNGGTTVSGTMTIAQIAGIKIFATGGIGGIHRGSQTDVSADLPTLSDIPLIVVCSGAKSILDLPATREYLETMGIPVIGYQTDDFPAFFSKTSGLKVDYRLNTAQEIADFAKLHWKLGMETAVLVTVPVPDDSAIPNSEIDRFINQALEESGQKNIHGSETTPYLLKRVSELTGAKSLKANIALLKNNARVAGEIAIEFYR